MPSAPYIPSTDAGFDSWLTNFETQTDTEFATYGLTAPEAALITAAQAAYNAAFVLANDPGTRTSVTVAAKDVAKASALATVRPLAIKVKLNPAVTDGQRALLGLTIDTVPATPIPTPTTFPTIDVLMATPGQHKLQYRDSATPTSKAKPYGAMQLELWNVIGTVEAVTPANAVYRGAFTKSPLVVDHLEADAGKIATYFGRWVTTTGKVGPWSNGVSLTIAW